MGIIKDEAAQTSAEFVLLFGGIIVIVLIAMIVYRNYVNDMGDELTNGSEVHDIDNSLQEINESFN